MMSTATMLMMARVKAGAGPQVEPGQEGEGRQGDDHRHEDAGHLVHQALDGGLAGLGLLHQADDLGEHHVPAHPGGLKDQEAPLVQGGAPNLAPRLLGHRQALAGEHGFIHAGGALHHHAVHRDLLAGAHQHQVAHADLIQRHFQVHAVPAHPGAGRRQGEEAADGLRGPAPGAGLQPAAQQDEGDDHQGGVVIDCRGVAGGRHRGGKEGDPGGIAVGRRGAQGHQGVHVGGAVPGGVPGAGEERGAGIEHHRGGEGQQDEVHGPVAQAQGVLHRRDHAGPHRQAEDQGHQEAVAELPDFGLGRARRALLPGGALHFVAGLLDHCAEGLNIGGLGVIPDLGLAGGQVDQGQFHPRGGGEGPLHPGHAGGAVQPPQGQGDFFGFSTAWLMLQFLTYYAISKPV